MRSSTHASTVRRLGVARVLSKRGICSRSQAEAAVRAGRITLHGKVVHNHEYPVREDEGGIALDGVLLPTLVTRHIALNKPRGLVTTARDEHDRDTVYRCFDGAALGWLAPVGRLDKASEGLLLFTNDPAWAARITDPASGPCKTYHVQVDATPDATLLQRIAAGVEVNGEQLSAAHVRLLRAGEKNAWLEIVLDEGRNRQIRRLLAAFDLHVLRLLRVAIGPLALGDLPKGQWRELTANEIAALSAAGEVQSA